MDGAQTRWRRQRRSARRRPRIIPGRRFALVLTLTLVPMGGSPASALADSTVVNATIYQGPGGGVITPAVTLSTLESKCPLYSGPGTSPMYLYPGGQPYQPAAGSSWALSTVLQCGLQLPLDHITSVQVDDPPPSTKGFELPLTSAQLSDPTQFEDSQAPQALPVISHDGGEDQNTYTRPFAGGSDDNAGDQVTESGPITLVVYENGSPLQVSATSKIGSDTATSMSVAFSATVQGADGTAIPASALTWSWNYGDGATSTDPAPTHSYTPTGNYSVTVQVTDPSAGWGGTATITVSPPPASGSDAAPGGGTSRTAKAHTGPRRSSGTKARGPAGKTKTRTRTSGTGTRAHGNATAGSTATSGATAPGSATIPAGPDPSTSPVTTTPAVPPPPTATPQPSRSTVAPHSHIRAKRRRAPTATTAPARLVTGQLISDVTPLPPSSSPLVHTVAAPPATAPAARRAVAGASSLAAIGAGLAIAVLLGLGAGRELSWHHRWRGWRPWRPLGMSR